MEHCGSENSILFSSKSRYSGRATEELFTYKACKLAPIRAESMLLSPFSFSLSTDVAQIDGGNLHTLHAHVNDSSAIRLQYLSSANQMVLDVILCLRRQF